MTPLYIFDGIRTPFSRSGTELAHLSAVDLGRLAVTSLFVRHGFNAEHIDETIIGCVIQPADSANPSRIIALRSGVPKDKPAMTVNRNCASGLQAVATAQEKLAAGQGSLFLVGGTESMSQTPLLFRHEAALKFAMLSRAKTFGARTKAMAAFRPQDFLPLIALKMGLTDPVTHLNMGETAEVLAREFRIPRDVQDAFAVRSHLQAAANREALQEEIAPVYHNPKQPVAICGDNGVRPDSSLEKLAKLQPIFDPLTGSVTAGNSSQISDGAVALLVGDERHAGLFKTPPLGRVVSQAFTGCDPIRMGLGPVKAIDLALKRAQWKLDDVDLIEINEAFAAQTLAVLKCLSDPTAARRAGLDTPLGEIDQQRLNPQGGAIALGHPIGASGARLILTALKQLQRTGKKRALVSLCVGGGQGVAMCLERP